MKRDNIVLILVLLLAAGVSAENTAAKETAGVINDVLCRVIFILFIIAPGIGAIIITLEGIRWSASADDPGARKRAKEGIIHAVVGLIIVLVAIPLVTMVMSGTQRFYACVSYITGAGGSSTSPGVVVYGPYQQAPLIGSNDNFLTNLPLYEGWNLISTPFILSDSNISRVFANVTYDIIYAWNPVSQSWDYYVPNYGGNLTYMYVDLGYWILVKKNTSVLFYGKQPYPVRNVTLFSGWNLIGFSGYSQLPVGTALEGVDYVYLYGWNATQAMQHMYGVGWSYSSPLGIMSFRPPPKPPVMKDNGFSGMPQLSELAPGMGYWIYVDRNISWIYPTRYPS
jgi:hypothetical protein